MRSPYRLAVVLVLFAATVAAHAPAALAAEGTMKWGVHVSLTPAFFDPADGTGTALPLMVWYAVHDALVRPLPGARMGAALAQSWQQSADGLTYEFVLRKGVKFQNGDPVTAEDVKFSFERYRGASATLLKAKVAAVEIVDPLRVRFRLKQPWPDFMTFYGTPATGAAWIVPKKYVEKVGDEGFKRAPVGAGPYRLVSFKPGVELVLEAFPGYWRKAPAIKTLVFKVIPDDATRLAALKTGEVDVAYGIAGTLAEEVKRTPGLALKAAKIPVTNWMVFADQADPKSPWHDRRVRLAANWSVNREAINSAGYLGLGTISSSFIPHSMEYFWQPPLYPYDPKGARALLAEAGYPNGFDAGELSGETFSGSGIGEPVVNDLNAVGIRVRLRLLERATYLKQWGDKTLKNIILAGSGAPGNAATRLEQYAVTGGLYAYGSYPEVDGLYNAQANESNPRARRQILVKMQQIIHERVMFGPVLEYAYLVAVGPKVAVDCVNALPDDPYTAPYEDLRLKPK
ncbi:MAG TPA: ABC transporter substrate-binding protein [Methylomirabilota bacterium]